MDSAEKQLAAAQVEKGGAPDRTPMAAMDAARGGLLQRAPSATSAGDMGTTAGGGGVNGWAGLALTLGLTPAASAPAPSLQPPSTNPSGDCQTSFSSIGNERVLMTVSMSFSVICLRPCAQ